MGAVFFYSPELREKHSGSRAETQRKSHRDEGDEWDTENPTISPPP